MDVSTWLRDLGLENYVQAFQARDIDAELLSRLTAEDLIALGVTSVGHRHRLLDAIATLHHGTASGRAQPSAATRPAEAERRQLTVLFCDLVDSTELAARLDPEDLHDVIGTYHRATAAVIEHFEGHVAKYLGDGVLAYFGWPRAHEDDAERAVRAGLELVEAVARLEPHTDARLQARIGIATGQVVVGDLVGAGATRDEAVIGDTPNLAARLQALAAPGMVVIGPATRRLIGGLFQLGDLGPQHLKGFAEPLLAWRVAGAGFAEDRFEARQTADLTPLVGRAEEIALLLRRWRQAQGGRGQVVLLSGEPGIGKSRLVRELRARLAEEPYVRLLYQCSPHHTTSPLHPVVEQLEHSAGFARDDPPEARLDKLESLLARGTNQLDRVVPLVAALLGLSTEDRYPPLGLTPQRQKQRTLEVLLDQLEGLAAGQAVLLVCEDAHWIDPTTRELLALTFERIQPLRVLLLITFRSEFTLPSTGHPYISALRITRLRRSQVAAMVDRVVGGKALPVEVSAQIVAKTDGVPLFVEELTKMVLESGLLRDAGNRYELAGPLPPLAIPSTLQDSLLARLDRLASVKEIAQTGACIGREFSHELLAAVASLDDNELRDAVNRLLESGLILRRGPPSAASYAFKHTLVQEAACGTLLRNKRQQQHARIARALEERFPETAETKPELLAHHCAQAGLITKAVGYWRKAGQLAIARSAAAEAVAQLTQGLELLQQLPDDDERRWWELDLQVALGSALITAKGYAAPETAAAYARAYQLCREAGAVRRLFPVLFGRYVTHLLGAKLAVACEAAAESLRLSEWQDDTATLVTSHRSVGTAAFALGNLRAARTHLEKALALYDPERHRRLALVYAQDVRVAGLSWLALALFVLGFPEQALRRSDEAVAAAPDIRHPNTTAQSLLCACILSELVGRRKDVQAHAELLIALATQHGLPFWLAMGTIMRGWALADAGEAEAGIAQLRRGLVAWEDTGAALIVPYYLGLLAKALAKAGRASEGLGALTEALDRVAGTEELWFKAELHRLRGELLLILPEPDQPEAEASFRQAFAVAREQDAKTWQLRAATSLAGLWRDQGKHAEAHDLLAPVYGWFTEGFDTADLKDAKALLDQLE